MNQFVMKHIPFPSINQFRQVVKNIRSSAEYHQVPYPTVKFEGSVKLHGTNCAIVRPAKGKVEDIYFQSRERLCIIESDNAAFAFNQTGNLQLWNEIFDHIETLFPAQENDFVQIYGEWCGGNIQKGVGISGLPKMFVIFAVRISENAESTDWFNADSFMHVFDKFKSQMKTVNIFTKYDFDMFYETVDFSNPEHSQNRLVDLTVEVEKRCPVASRFRDTEEELIGEGLVWTPVQTADLSFCVQGNMFKTKGTKHSASKVRTIAAVDVEKMESVDKFVEYVVTENRLNQGLEKMKEMNIEIDPKNTGQFIRWIMGDVIKEESDVMRESNLTPKDVTSKIASEARQFWLNQ